MSQERYSLFWEAWKTVAQDSPEYVLMMLRAPENPLLRIDAGPVHT
jgi:hypothetical protein